MKLQLILLAALAIAAPAAAQTYKPYDPNKPWTTPSHPPRSGWDSYDPNPRPTASPRRDPFPTPPAYKPYRPPSYPYGSSYAHPRNRPKGARDCELSVYVNACDR